MNIAPVILVTLLAAACSNSSFSGGSPSSKNDKAKTSDPTPEKDGDDDGATPTTKGTNPDDEDLPLGGKLQVEPATMTLFKGESAQAKALLVESGKKTDVTDDSTWSSADDDIAPVSNAGKVAAENPGDVAIEVAQNGLTATLQVHVVKCKSTAAGQTAKTVKIDGENWPNNTVDAGGGDKDDYHVTITGDFLVDGFQLFAKSDQDISVSYALGTPGSTTQTVALSIIDCDGKVVQDEDVSKGSGTQVFKAKKGQRFTLITTAHTGAKTRSFRLDQDTPDSTAADAFRVTTP